MPEQMSLVPVDREQGRLIHVDLALIQPNEELHGAEPTPAFKTSVEQFGVLQPVALIETISRQTAIELAAQSEVPNFHTVCYLVAAGKRRVKAARAAGLPSVPAIVFSPEWTPTEVLTLIENAQRRENPIGELDALNRLMTRFEAEGNAGIERLRDAAKELGLSRDRVEMLWRIRTLRPELYQALSEGNLAFGVAAEASKLTDQQQGRLVALLQYHGRLTGEDVTQVRQVGAIEATAALPDFLFEERQAVPAGVQANPNPSLGYRRWDALNDLSNFPRMTGIAQPEPMRLALWLLSRADTLLELAGEHPTRGSVRGATVSAIDRLVDRLRLHDSEAQIVELTNNARESGVR